MISLDSSLEKIENISPILIMEKRAFWNNTTFAWEVKYEENNVAIIATYRLKEEQLTVFPSVSIYELMDKKSRIIGNPRSDTPRGILCEVEEVRMGKETTLILKYAFGEERLNVIATSISIA